MQTQHDLPLYDFPPPGWYLPGGGRKHHYYNNLGGLTDVEPQGMIDFDKPTSRTNWRMLRIRNLNRKPICGSTAPPYGNLYRPRTVWRDQGECVSCRKKLNRMTT